MKYVLYLIINQELLENNYITEEEFNYVNDILYKKIKKCNNVIL